MSDKSNVSRSAAQLGGAMLRDERWRRPLGLVILLLFACPCSCMGLCAGTSLLGTAQTDAWFIWLGAGFFGGGLTATLLLWRKSILVVKATEIVIRNFLRRGQINPSTESVPEKIRMDDPLLRFTETEGHEPMKWMAVYPVGWRQDGQLQVVQGWGKTRQEALQMIQEHISPQEAE